MKDIQNEIRDRIKIVEKEIIKQIDQLINWIKQNPNKELGDLEDGYFLDLNLKFGEYEIYEYAFNEKLFTVMKKGDASSEYMDKDELVKNLIIEFIYQRFYPTDIEKYLMERV